MPAATRISLLRKFRKCAFQARPRASPPSKEGTLNLGRRETGERVSLSPPPLQFTVSEPALPGPVTATREGIFRSSPPRFLSFLLPHGSLEKKKKNESFIHLCMHLIRGGCVHPLTYLHKLGQVCAGRGECSVNQKVGVGVLPQAPPWLRGWRLDGQCAPEFHGNLQNQAQVLEKVKSRQRPAPGKDGAAWSISGQIIEGWEDERALGVSPFVDKENKQILSLQFLSY